MLTEVHQLLKNQSKNPKNKFQCELGDLWEEKLLHVGNIFALFQSRYDFNEWQRYIFFPKKKLKIIEAKIKNTNLANTVRQLDWFVDRWKTPDRRLRCTGNDLYVYTYSSVSLIDLFKEFLSPDYIVPNPDDIKSLREHLECIWLYYRFFYPTMDFIPIDVCLRLEFVIHKLISQILFLIGIEGLKTLETVSRMKEAIRSMEDKKNKLGELIIKEFHGLKDSTKKGKNDRGGKERIYRAILSKLNSKVKNGKIDPRDYGKKDGEKLTSKDTVKRRLEDENLI